MLWFLMILAVAGIGVFVGIMIGRELEKSSLKRSMISKLTQQMRYQSKMTPDQVIDLIKEGDFF
jgi:hypothetical protein